MDDVTELRFTKSTSHYANDEKVLIPIDGKKQSPIRVFFVYGVDFDRSRTYFNPTQFWRSGDFWLFSIMLLVSAVILYVVRRIAKIRKVNFMVGLLEMFAVAVGGGNLRYQHRFEKIFFAIALIASFSFVSIYLADFSMHSVLNEPRKVDTFEKLAEQNVTFYMTSELVGVEMQVNHLLR